MSGSHRLIACAPDDLVTLLEACCAEQAAAGPSTGLRRRLPAGLDRRLLTNASGSFETPHRADMVSTTRFGPSRWQLTCDQGAHGSIAHLQLGPTPGPVRLLPRPVQVVYLSVIGNRMLQTLHDYALRQAP